MDWEGEQEWKRQSYKNPKYENREVLMKWNQIPEIIDVFD